MSSVRQKPLNLRLGLYRQEEDSEVLLLNILSYVSIAKGQPTGTRLNFLSREGKVSSSQTKV